MSRGLPLFDWAREYRREWLLADGWAGITLAAYAIPVSLAYATLAGLPPHCGIYCYLVGGLVYAVFGSSRQLAIGPTSAIAMLVGTTVGGMVAGDAARWAAVASLAALCVGVIGILAGLLRLSGLVNFISETILVGFKAGAALSIAMTQLPKLFGVEGGGTEFFERVWILASQLPQTNWFVLGAGLVVLAALLLGDRFFPGRPTALVVVASAIAITGLFHLDRHGLETVGVIPAGLPGFAMPSLRARDVDGVLPLAAACFLLAYVEAISAAKAIAARHGYEVNPRQEMLAISAANVAAAFSQGFPITGGLSQSAVNDKAGAKTPLALVFASVAIGICLVFFTGLLRELPNVVLAAIVLVAVSSLFDVAALARLWRVSRTEFALAMVALGGVVTFGILEGVLLAVIVSLLSLVADAARPHVAFLGRVPGTTRFSDMARHGDNKPVPGVVIFRVEASLLYFNTDHVKAMVRERVAATESLRLVICDLSNSPRLDMAGANMLDSLRRELGARDARLRVVEPHARIRDLLHALGLADLIGEHNGGDTIERAIAESP